MDDPHETLKTAVAGLADKTLLLMDDDAPFRNRLARALETRGFTVVVAEGVHQAMDIIAANPPAFAVFRHSSATMSTESVWKVCRCVV